mgnify:CR=1 FL=1
MASLLRTPCIPIPLKAADQAIRYCKEDSSRIETRLKGDEEWTDVKEGVPFEEQFPKTGVYEIRETDAAVNKTIHEAFLDLSSPDVQIETEIYS